MGAERTQVNGSRGKRGTPHTGPQTQEHTWDTWGKHVRAQVPKARGTWIWGSPLPTCEQEDSEFSARRGQRPGLSALTVLTTQSRGGRSVAGDPGLYGESPLYKQPFMAPWLSANL